MYIHYAQHSFRMLTSALLLSSLVLVNSYSSILISSMTIPFKSPPINSFEDLVVSKDVALIFRKDFVVGKTILVMLATITLLKLEL